MIKRKSPTILANWSQLEFPVGKSGPSVSIGMSLARMYSQVERYMEA